MESPIQWLPNMIKVDDFETFQTIKFRRQFFRVINYHRIVSVTARCVCHDLIWLWRTSTRKISVENNRSLRWSILCFCSLMSPIRFFPYSWFENNHQYDDAIKKNHNYIFNKIRSKSLPVTVKNSLRMRMGSTSNATGRIDVSTKPVKQNTYHIKIIKPQN